MMRADYVRALEDAGAQPAPRVDDLRRTSPLIAANALTPVIARELRTTAGFFE